MSLQITLEPDPSLAKRGDRSTEIGVITKALPFYQRKPDCFVHRVRHGTVYQLTHRVHTAFHFWCANTGFISEQKDGRLLPEIPKGAKPCRWCDYKLARHLERTQRIWHNPTPRPTPRNAIIEQPE